MKLYYYKDSVGNFGDDLNPWLWERRLPDFFDEDAATIFVGIGTLLNHRVPKASKTIVFGSGVGYGDLPVVDDSWDICFVRGPLSAKALGLDENKGITDPAILVSSVELPKPTAQHDVSFIPHHVSSMRGDWGEVCRLSGLNYIDPASNVVDVLSEIRSSKLVVTEAMHGAIISDALRVPWISVCAYEHILDFKWRDWTQSMGLPLKIVDLPPVWSGPKDTSLSTRLKVELKRGLLASGIWKGSWAKPFPRKSSRTEMERVAAKLLDISKTEEPILSADKNMEARLSQVEEKILEVTKKYRP